MVMATAPTRTEEDGFNGGPADAKKHEIEFLGLRRDERLVTKLSCNH